LLCLRKILRKIIPPNVAGPVYPEISGTSGSKKKSGFLMLMAERFSLEKAIFHGVFHGVFTSFEPTGRRRQSTRL
jgi:hypothetical protein